MIYPRYEEILAAIVAEIENRSGKTVQPFSDTMLRAQGLAAAIEGIHDSTAMLERQLFAQTADAEHLADHAAREGITRAAAVPATGLVLIRAQSSGAAVPSGTLLTDGQGGSYATTAAAVWTGTADPYSAIVPVQAQTAGVSSNRRQGSVLSLQSAPAGVYTDAQVLVLSGGADQEDVEAWRYRIVTARAARGRHDRAQDYERMARGVAGVGTAQAFPRRRGPGTVDVCITAVSALGYDTPSPALLAAVQDVIDDEAPATSDSRAFAPEDVPTSLAVVVKGPASTAGRLPYLQSLVDVLLARIRPGQTLQISDIVALLRQQIGVSDVVVTPSSNVVPVVDWQRVQWIRATAGVSHVVA